LLLAVLCAILPKPVAASPVTYTFTGAVTFLNVLSADPALTDIDAWLPGLADGMSMSGSFVFDDVSGPGALRVTLGSYVFAADSYTESVVNDSTFAVNDSIVPFGDSVSFWDSFPKLLTPPPSAFRGDDLYLTLWDSTGAALSGNTVHAGDLSRFTQRLITFDGLGFSPTGSAIIDWQARIDTFQATPEPSSLLLLGSGLAGLAGTGRRLGRRGSRDR
jgi:hypothetical protein